MTEVYDFLARRIEWAEASGIPRERIAIDPGIGFGKTRRAQSRDIAEPRAICQPGVCDPGRSLAKGVSRFDHRQAGVRARAATVAASLEACLRGARVVRVHDVAEMADAIRVWTALGRWEFRS